MIMDIWKSTPEEGRSLCSVLHYTKLNIDLRDVLYMLRKSIESREQKHRYLSNCKSNVQGNATKLTGYGTTAAAIATSTSINEPFQLQPRTTPWNYTGGARPRTSIQSRRTSFSFAQLKHSELKSDECAFCKSNGEEFYDHEFKDKLGRVVCPVLSAFTCKSCGATGPNAHTWKFCPMNPRTRGDPIVTGLPAGLPSSLIKYN